MKRFKIIYFVLLAALLSSCEGFLDLYPTNAAPAQTSIKTANDAKVMINGLYRSLTSSSYYGRNMFLYADAKGGDFAVRALGRGNDGLYTFNHAASSGSYSTFWSQGYYCLLQVNNLLENIERIEEDGNGSTALSNYKGQAHTLRAMIYFDLVRLYGRPYTEDQGASLGVPKITEVLGVYDQPTRNTVKEIYTLILEDLEAAKDIITKPTTASTLIATNGTMNYYGNRAILARVLLYMGNYADALIAAEEVINCGRYSPYSNAQWTSSWSAEFGSESIFELGIYVDEADLLRTSLGYYLTREGKVTGASGYFMASDSFLARLGEDANDVRWSVMERDESSTTRLGSCLKYTGIDNKGDKGSMSAVNIKVIRLSEIYLIAAEAALLSPTPNKTLAAQYLQEIRKRAPGLAAATASNIDIDMILDERSKEFFMEGHRFFDMMRHGKSITFNDDFLQGAISETLRPQTIQPNFYKTILPIPKAEMDANPAIRGQQNPGY